MCWHLGHPNPQALPGFSLYKQVASLACLFLNNIYCFLTIRKIKTTEGRCSSVVGGLASRALGATCDVCRRNNGNGVPGLHFLHAAHTNLDGVLLDFSSPFLAGDIV